MRSSSLVIVYIYIYIDIDECAEYTDNCDKSHAECSNTVGGYECECNVGFTGDGYDCGRV